MGESEDSDPSLLCSVCRQKHGEFEELHDFKLTTDHHNHAQWASSPATLLQLPIHLKAVSLSKSNFKIR